jgi:hypothetical protein
MSTPILWAQRGRIGAQRPARKWVDGELVPVEDEHGRPVVERFPVAGRVGLVRQVEDIATTKPQPQPRFITFMKDGTKGGGAVVFCPITASAASDPQQDKSFEISVRQKARENGWIQVGRCPIDVAMSGEILGREKMLEAPENREAFKRGERCSPGVVGQRKPPCKHWIVEEAARKAVRAADDAKLKRKTPVERQAEAFEKFVDRLGDKLADDEAPQPKPRKGKQEPGE